MQHVAAALELIAGDADIGKENGESAEHARGLVVAGFEQIGQRELRKFASARRNEVDEQQAEPAAGRLPERGKAVAVGVFRPGKERSGADPRSEQREHKDEGRQRAAGDQVVGLGLHTGSAIECDGQQRNDNDGQNNDIELGHPCGFLAGVYRIARSVPDGMGGTEGRLIRLEAVRERAVETLTPPRAVAKL